MTLLALVFGVAAPAAAGPVRGIVRTPPASGPFPAPEGDFYWRVGNGFVPVRRARRDLGRDLAVVLLGSGEQPLGCEYGLRGGDFFPKTMVVRPGAVRFANHDGFAYTLTSDDIELDGSELRSGNNQDVTFAAGGPFTLHDSVHEQVEGVVHVIPELAACAAVNADGSYTFPDLPAGEYTLKVLRGPTELASQRVNVGSGPLTVDPIDLPAS